MISRRAYGFRAVIINNNIAFF